jgi:predicted MPP superfamily phosphohydrolase
MTTKLKYTKILVLSDIHFGKSTCNRDFALPGDSPEHLMEPAVSMKENLISVTNGYEFDAIFVLGDLTSFGLPSEFKGCGDIIREIARNLRVDEGNIFFAFGNHDVDWNISRLADQGTRSEPLYKELAATTGTIFLNHENKKYLKGPVPSSGVYFHDKANIFIVNSGYYSTHDQTFSHGKLGDRQLSWLKESLDKHSNYKKWNILILHHHPRKYSYPSVYIDISCVEEGSELLDIIGSSKIDLVLHGHRHHPILFTQMITGWIAPKTFLCSGSLSVNSLKREYGQIPNTFHIVTLFERLGTGGALGDVETFEYTSHSGWEKCKYKKTLPMDPKQKFGDCAPESVIKNGLENLIKTRIAETSDSALYLTPYVNLPVEAQCLNYHVLNNMIKDISVVLNVKVKGDYPDEVLILVKR